MTSIEKEKIDHATRASIEDVQKREKEYHERAERIDKLLRGAP